MTPEQIEEMKRDRESGTPGPCPKCGSQNTAIHESTNHGYSVYGRWWYGATCDNCSFFIMDREVFNLDGLLVFPEKDCVNVWKSTRIPDMEAHILALTAENACLRDKVKAANVLVGATQTLIDVSPTSPLTNYVQQSITAYREAGE